MKTFHAAVWLDHNEARIFHIAKDGFDETVLHPETPQRHMHRKSGPGAVSGRRTFGDPAFFEDVSKALTESQEILVLGPANAKLELIKYLHKHHALVAEKVLGVETVDHPSDRQIVAYARQYFEVADGQK